MSTGVMTKRPTRGVRRGLRIIADRLNDDFENAFERIFPDVPDKTIMDICEALEWLEQYAVDEDVL